MLKLQALPEQSPPKPSNRLLAPGVAVSTTLVPGGNVALHAPDGQVRPAGVELMAPVPVPFLAAESWNVLTTCTVALPWMLPEAATMSAVPGRAPR